MKKLYYLMPLCIYWNTFAQTTTGCFTTLSAGGDSSMGIKADGTLWGWGERKSIASNITQLNINTPKISANPSVWQAVSMGKASGVGLKTDGTIWRWGNGPVASIAFTSNPVKIGTATNWKTVTAGLNNFFAIKTDGTLWGMGSNALSQLGNNTMGDQASMVQIGTDTNWKSVSCGQAHVMAIKTDGTLWGWGLSGAGQVGYGYTSTQISPVQIGTGTDWLMVETGSKFTLAIKTNGTLWAWGSGLFGVLGIQSAPNSQLVPIQVGTDTWKFVSADNSHVAAIRTDGSLWTWGFNPYGELGHANTPADGVSYPKRVGSANNWIAVATGFNHTLALTDAGDVYSWGRNDSGQSGSGNYIQYNEPHAIACPTSIPAKTNDFEVEALKVYPNPVDDLLHVSFGNENSLISIYNLLGQEIIVKSIRTGKDIIDVSMLQSGAYLVKVVSGNRMKTLKLIKE